MAYVNPQLGLEAKERGNQYFRDGNYPDAIKVSKPYLLSLKIINVNLYDRNMRKQ
jgi:hypothetical protein